MRESIASAHTVCVFHGSSERTLKLAPAPLYGVRDFGFAASYGLERSDHGHAFVHTLNFRFKNICDQNTLLALFERHGIDPWPVYPKSRIHEDSH
jgi:hypothetical protein